MENDAGEWDLASLGTFSKKILSKFLKIQTSIQSHFLMTVASNLANWLLSTRSFHFWHPFCAMTSFRDQQGHMTLSCLFSYSYWDLCDSGIRMWRCWHLSIQVVSLAFLWHVFGNLFEIQSQSFILSMHKFLLTSMFLTFYLGALIIIVRCVIIRIIQSYHFSS